MTLLLAAAAGAYWLYCAPNPSGDRSVTTIIVKKGMTLNQVARKLSDAGLIDDVRRFALAARILKAERRLQPGAFSLPSGLSNLQLLRHLTRARVRAVNVTIPEGLTMRQVAGIVCSRIGGDSTRFVELCEDSFFAASLGIDAGRLEGYLFPETYNFYQNSREEDIIARMVAQFQAVFNDTLDAAAGSHGLTVHKAVTLASIIQGEVMIWEEAPLVSSVYHNRLKRCIALDADPTIQYIIPDGPRRLFLKDLDIDSPYNTYLNRGLPPGPIGSPGQRALEAAVHPADTDYIYFVAKGDGSHFFNSTHEGHQRDKEKLQRVRRELERQKALDEGG